MIQNLIDTTNASFQCVCCKERTTQEFSVYEDKEGRPDLERLIEEVSEAKINCPNCKVGACLVAGVKISNKIVNHQAKEKADG